MARAAALAPSARPRKIGVVAAGLRMGIRRDWNEEQRRDRELRRKVRELVRR